MQGLVTDRTQANVLRRSELAAKGWANMTADEQAEWLGSPLAGEGVNLLPYAPYYSSVVTLKHTNDAITATASADGSYLYAVLIVGAASEFVNRKMTLSADYIGTRTVGKDIDVFPRQTLSSGVIMNLQYALQPGVVYNVHIGGAVYPCEAHSLGSSGAYLGNPTLGGASGVHNNEPFYIAWYGGTAKSAMFFKDSSLSYPLTVWVTEYGSAYEASPQIAMYWHDGNGFEAVGASLSAAGSITFDTGGNPGGREYLAMYIYVTTDITVTAGASVRFRGVMLEFGDTRHEYVPHTEILPTNATKGAYNYSDMNRVERAAAELSDLYGLNLETKTDWDVWSVPQASDMVRYITNVKKIRHASLHPNSMAAAPDGMAGLNYNDANNIEKILLTAHENTDHIVRFGELYSGEV